MAEAETSGSQPKAVRVGRILNAYLDRRARGEPASEAELLAAHPDLAVDLRCHLEMLGNLPPSDHKIAGLIAQGMLIESTDPSYAAELGAYKISAFVGRGGMGIVLKAYEESLNRTVALKLLRPELADDDTAVQRFFREAKATAALRHPNIVTIYAVGKERDAPFLAMEFVEGPSLAEVIREAAASEARTCRRAGGSLSDPAATGDTRARGDSGEGESTVTDTPRHGGPLGVEMTRRIFRQLLDGLACAHKAGLIHRDIKSANVLLDGPEGRVKIADFGLARMIAAQTRLTLPASVLGTPEYMSPEQARGDEHLDHRTDLYSAGVVLYEMLTGRTPFQADTPSAVIHSILHEEPPDPRSISDRADPRLASLALRLMAKDPADRFASAAEAIAALEGGRPVRSRAVSRRFRRRAVTVVMTLVVAGCAALLLREFAGQQPPIVAARIDPTERCCIQVRGPSDTTWRAFHRFPPAASEIAAVKIADLDGQGTLAVVAGVKRDIDGSCLFVFDTSGNRLQAYDLSSPLQWPDCGLPKKWICAALAVGDLDDRPGDEIVAAASDPGIYPSRVSIIDPRTREIRSTFWHMGDINVVSVIPGFFPAMSDAPEEPRRPAIVATGPNNKLDGFDAPGTQDPPRPYECEAGEDPPSTSHGFVYAMMILDPADMNGLGPPRNGRIDIPAARPFAYAFLDLAPNRSVFRLPDDEEDPREPGLGDYGRITRVIPGSYADEVTGRTAPWFVVVVRGGAMDTADAPGRAELTLDRNLDLQDFESIQGERIGTDIEYWKECWRPIIQRGEYLMD